MHRLKFGELHVIASTPRRVGATGILWSSYDITSELDRRDGFLRLWRRNYFTCQSLIGATVENREARGLIRCKEIFPNKLKLARVVSIPSTFHQMFQLSKSVSHSFSPFDFRLITA